jgi:hypothetical protein
MQQPRIPLDVSITGEFAPAHATWDCILKLAQEDVHWALTFCPACLA